MPKLLPKNPNPKTLELLQLVRKSNADVKAYTYFKNLNEQEQIEVAKELHENIELVFYNQKKLQQVINSTYSKVQDRENKSNDDFEELIEKFIKYIDKALGLQVAMDIVKSYDINRFNKDEINLILLATAAEDQTLIEALLLTGADPTLASSKKYRTAWTYILTKLTDLNEPDVNEKFKKILDLFIKYGANPVSGYTLSLVKKSNDSQLIDFFATLPEVEFINKLNQAIETQSFKQDTIEKFAEEYKFSSERLDQILNARNEEGMTLLMAAIEEQNVTAVTALLRYNIDINVQDNDGVTAVHYASLQDKSWVDNPVQSLKRDHILNLLLKHHNSENPGRDANIFIKSKNNITPLDLRTDRSIFYLGNTTYYFIEALIADISANRKTEALTKLSYLIANKTDIDIYNVFNYQNKNQSILFACAATGNLEIFKFAIESGLINENNLQKQLLQSLEIAVLYNQINILEYLDSWGINFNTPVDSSGFTALQIAAQANTKESIKFLLSKKANPNIKNLMGNSALDIALINGHHEAAKMLLAGDLYKAGYTELMQDLMNKNIVMSKKHIKDQSQKILEVTAGGFDALMIAAMNYDKNLDPATRTEFFNLILDLIDRSDVLRINKNKYNFLQIFSYLSDKDMVALFKHCTTEKFIKNHDGKNWLHICAILGFDFSLLYYINISFKELNTFVNALDNDGNSPLSYLLFNTKYDIKSESILNLLTRGARFIRNGIESKLPLNIKAMLSYDKVLQLSDQEIANINEIDQDGRTALHIACMRNKPDMTKGLLALGADMTQPDIFGCTALHYAAENNLVIPEFKKIELWDVENNLGITPLITAIQLATKPAKLVQLYQDFNNCSNEINRIALSFYAIKNTTDIDQVINSILVSENLVQSQKIALIYALNNYVTLTSPMDHFDDKEQLSSEESKQILANYKNQERFKIAEYQILQDKFLHLNPNWNDVPGMALGIELEIPGLRSYSIIPTAKLNDLYPITFTHDPTVINTLLSSNVMPDQHAKLELVSDVINTQDKYNQFLDVCGILKYSGSTVNASAGMHVHFNCRGTTKLDPPLARFVKEKHELDYLKYVAINYIRIENLLRGFMRDSALYDLYGRAYVQSLSQYEEAIKSCGSILELQDICSHNKTLDFTALNRHGTIEFRVHEATIDPILINAWVDCLSRLVIASRNQAQQHKEDETYEATSNIEELVTLLIASRQYNVTWDPNWAAFEGSETLTASAYPGKDTRPVQVQIQDSPLYKLAHMFIAFDKDATRDTRARIENFFADPANSNFFDDGKFTKNRVLQDLKDLLVFTLDNQGLFKNSPDIEPAIRAIETILHSSPKP